MGEYLYVHLVFQVTKKSWLRPFYSCFASDHVNY
jgi:hypothetical protein